MNLEIACIASSRKRRSRDVHNMDYLLSEIRRELEDRTRIQVQQSGTNPGKGLVIDFSGTDLHVSDSGEIEYCSLLEAGEDISGKLAACADQSLDCVVENLQVGWLDFTAHLREISRILKPGGFYAFSCFGPDTLYELWEAWHPIDDKPHIHDFVDMHHLGDAMLKTGFQKPIVDADWTFIDFPDVDTLILDLRSEGFINVRSDRRKSLTGKNRFHKFRNQLESQVMEGESLRITFEVVYGLGIKSDASQSASVRVTPPEHF